MVLSHPTQSLKGVISLTSSKSENNRALIIQALCAATFEIKNSANAKDTVVLTQLLKSDSTTLDVGIAGTVMRFLTAYLSIQDREFVLTGDHRMKERPIKILVESLQQLGAKIEYLENEGYPPLKIRGQKNAGGTIEIDGSVSSQYISALLLIAPQLKNGLTLQFKGEVTSKPYINMTISMMRYFGADVYWQENAVMVDSGEYKAKDFIIEADWSAASYWYGMVALAPEADITLQGLKKESLQGDAMVQEIYSKLGVNTEFVENGIRLTKNSEFRIQNLELEIDFSDCPDIAQTVAVTCAALNIETRLTGLKTLRIKETDRIAALQTELNGLGFNVEVENDDIIVLASKEKLTINSNHSVETYNDHRMAMAFAPLALLSQISIKNPEVVEKSYPNFWEDLKGVGVEMN